MVKILENISCYEELIETIESGKNIVNKRNSVTESWYLDKELQALAYHLSAPRNITITLDIRQSNDFDEWGRNYSISQIKDGILIHYQKKDSPGNIQYQYYVAIIGILNCTQYTAGFEKKEYCYDQFRGTNGVWYPYVIKGISSSNCTIGVADSIQKAEEYARELYHNFHKRYHADHRYKNIHPHHHHDKKAVSLWHAEQSLDQLTTEQGIYAGYPWFFQYWMRDEMISASWLINQQHYSQVIALFKKYLHSIEELPSDGVFKAMPPNVGNKSIDGLGWLAKRIQDTLQHVKTNKNVLRRTIEEEIEKFIPALVILEERVSKSRMNTNLIVSHKDETWMDTSSNDSGRAGYCIEIQALHLRLLHLLYELTNNIIYLNKSAAIAHTVRQQFYDGYKLADHITIDGHTDVTPRPNIFIAAYVYPELFEKNIWEEIIDHTLDSLWCSWGGLSSISKDHPLYTPQHTGQNNKSYHRGDSWYFLNCLAAIVMQRVNHHKYHKQIHAILNATIYEQMECGVIGSVAEISNASSLESYGCQAQSWSAAMLIELINELNSHDK